MKVLIDTHLLLWWMGNDGSLSRAAAELIAASENTVFVSAVSMWEIRLKQSLGKLDLPADFEERLDEESFERLPLTGRQTGFLVGMEWHHKDPFDRMLVAQAEAEGLIFATADGRLGAYGGLLCGSSDAICLMHENDAGH